MFGGLRKKLEELTAQANPFDGGKTAATVRAARTNPAPARTVKATQPARPMTTQQRVDQSYGAGFGGVKNRLRDVFGDNTEADKIKRYSATGLAESFAQEQARKTQAAQNDPTKRSTVQQITGNALGGLSEFAKLPPQAMKMKGNIENSTLGKVATFANPATQASAIGDELWKRATGQDTAKKRNDLYAKVGGSTEEAINNKIQQSGLGNRNTDNRIVAGVSRAGGQLLGQVAGTVASGGSTLPSAAMGLQTASSQYDQARKAGKSNDYAVNTGLGQGVVSGALEKVGFDKLGGSGNRLVSAVKGFGTEGAQEGVQQLAQNLITNRTYNPNQGIKEGVAESALIGGITGGVAGPLMGRPTKPTTSLVAPKPEPTRTRLRPEEARIWSDYQETLYKGNRMPAQVVNETHNKARQIADSLGVDIITGSPDEIAGRMNPLLEQSIAFQKEPTTGLVSRARSRLTPLNEGGYISLGAPEPKKLPQDIKDQFSKQGSFGREAMDRLEANKMSKGDLERAGVIFDPKQVKKIAQTLPEFKANPVMTYRKGDYSYTDAGYGRYPVPEKARSGVFEFKHSRGTMRLNPEALFGKEMAQKLAQTAKDGEQVDFTDTMKASGNRLFTYDQTPDKPTSTVAKPVQKQVTEKQNSVDPLESLKQEARKYKSAEEFVKAQGEPLYHGSPNHKIIRKEGFKSNPNGNNLLGEGVYMTRHRAKAENYSLPSDLPRGTTITPEMRSAGVVEGYIPKGSKIYQPETRAELKNISTKELQQQGFDGIEINGETVIFDQSKIKTREQLTDLYNQATQPPKTEGSVASELPKIYESDLAGLRNLKLSDELSAAEAKELGVTEEGFNKAKNIAIDYFNKVAKAESSQEARRLTDEGLGKLSNLDDATEKIKYHLSSAEVIKRHELVDSGVEPSGVNPTNNPTQPPKSTPVQKVDPLESLKQEARIDNKRFTERGNATITNGNSSARIKSKQIRVNGEVVEAIEIEAINSKLAGTGSATDLLNQIKKYADQENKRVVLKPVATPKSAYPKSMQPEKPLSQSGLVRWYENNGFKMDKNGNMKYVPESIQSQPPKSTPKTVEAKPDDTRVDFDDPDTYYTNEQMQQRAKDDQEWFRKQDILKANADKSDTELAKMTSMTKKEVAEYREANADAQKRVDERRANDKRNALEEDAVARKKIPNVVKRINEFSKTDTSKMSQRALTKHAQEAQGLENELRQVMDDLDVTGTQVKFDGEVYDTKGEVKIGSNTYTFLDGDGKADREFIKTSALENVKQAKTPTPFEKDLQAAGLAPKRAKGLVVSETKPLNGQKIQKVRTAPGKVEQRVVQDRSDEIADTLGIPAKDRVPTTDSQRAERVDTAAQKGLENIKNNPEIVRQAAAPSTLKDKTKRKTFEEATKKYLGGTRSAEIERQATIASLNKEFKLSDKEKINAIISRDDPSVPALNEKVMRYNDRFKQLTDAAYKTYTDQGVKMGYVSSYLPRIYKNPETGQEVDLPEFKALIQGSKRMKGREAEKVAVDWLVEKDPTKLLERYYKSMDNAVAGRQYMKDLEDNGLVVASTEPVRGMRPVIAEGLQTDGKVFYAQKDVAHKLNELFGSKEATNLVEKTLEKGAGVNSLFQSFVLSGGVPNTPINAFGMMQLLKEGMALHPIKAGRAFFGGGLSKSYANKVFTAKKDVMKLMAENDLDIRVNLEQTGKWGNKRIKDAFKNEGKAAGLNQAWNEFTNDATFGRFMPMLEVLHFENVYKHQLKGNLIRKPKTSAEAARIAAESTKNFYGKTSVYKTSTRSKAVDDAAGALLFAPRFRESMVNFWVKNAKTFVPTNTLKPEYRDNLKFMAASAAMYAAMTMLNEAMNGARMDENPDGKKDKLIIPASVAGKFGIDTKGKDIAVPFLPSIATVPRNLASLGANLATGKFNEAGKNAKAFASMPVKTVGDILTNEDYFGNKIVQDDSSPLQKFTQAASYVASSNMQPWIREGLNAKGQNLSKETKKTWGIKEKSTFETLSNAGELPLRFYKPDTYRYGENWTPKGGKDEKFDFKQQRERAALGGEIKNISKTLKLNKRQDELFKSLSSVEFNDDGTLKEDNNPFYKSQRYTALQDDGVFEAMKQKSKLNAKLNGKPIDPIFSDDLAPDQRRVLLWKKTLPPGTSDPTVKKLYEQDWYQDYRNKESAYFEGKKAWNKKMGYKDATPNTNEYPIASKDVEDAQNAYFNLPKGGARTAFRKNNPDVWNKMIAFWDSKDAWTNGERSKLGLGAVDDEDSGGFSYGGKRSSKRGGKGSKGGSKYDYTKNLFDSGSNSASTSKQLRAILQKAMSGKS